MPLPEKWTGYSQHSRDCLPMPTRYLPAREVLRFRDEAFFKCYTDPNYLEMAKRRFGLETVTHLREMTRHKLERHLLDGRLNVPPTLLPEEKAESVHSENLIQLQVRPGARRVRQMV